MVPNSKGSSICQLAKDTWTVNVNEGGGDKQKALRCSPASFNADEEKVRVTDCRLHKPR